MSTKIHRLNQVLTQPYLSEGLVNPQEISDLVQEHLKKAGTLMVCGLLLDEVKQLCGESYSRGRGEGGHFRSGSDPGSVILGGQRVRVKKPRVKRDGKDVPLQTYEALRGTDLLNDRIQKHMIRGVSTRDYEPLLDEISGGLGIKKSTVSKIFIQGSKQALETIRCRDLSAETYFAIMIDAIELAERSVTVALGISELGEKCILGLKDGDTENSEVCKDLLQDLIDRGLNKGKDHLVLFVLDGSKALAKAVKKVFGSDVLIQRCVRHKERNILSYLNDSDHVEFKMRWRRLHAQVKYSEAKLEYDRLRHWLGQKSVEAKSSLDESNQETLTVIRIGAAPFLRKTLTSTNPIESAFSVVRNSCSRVKRWRMNTDQVLRWTAAGLLHAESKFKKIRGHMHIKLFMTSMKELKQKNLLPDSTQAA